MTRCLQVPPQEAKRRKTVVMVGGMVVRRYDDTFRRYVRYVPRLLPHLHARARLASLAISSANALMLLLHPNFQLPLLSSTTIGTSYW